MNCVKKYLAVSMLSLAISAVTGLTASASSFQNEFDKAKALYERGMYAKALNILELLSTESEHDNVELEGYKVLCAVNLRTPGHEEMMNDFLISRPYSPLLPQIHYQNALNLFDDGDYMAADQEFSMVDSRDIQRKQVPAFVFKKAYCKFEKHEYAEARNLFTRVTEMQRTDFTAPAQYALGYIAYEEKQFSQAIPWFEKSVKDQRFESISKYYLLECHFMEKDYAYVLGTAPEQISQVPVERQPHVGRILSEAYLVNGDTESARKYYDEYVIKTAPQNRSDYFYAGSLLYAAEDYEGAIRNYSQMKDRSDSLGQIANYQMAFSYIKTKNKVAAMEAFKDASLVSFNQDMTEDAYFNYAKLAFDLNNDSTPFNGYVKKYSDTKRGDLVYSYMAIGALNSHDYASALAAYDKIDDLDKDQLSNFMKANYMRATELIADGSYRDATNFLKTAAYYSDKRSRFSQLSRYWVAESLFRSGNYSEARVMFTDLLNNSALEGMPEAETFKYNIAYCYFKEENYPAASKWFVDYLSNGNAKYAKSAAERNGDCFFMQQQYKEAYAAYSVIIDRYNDISDIYPYYQAALCCGLTKDRKGKVQMLERVMGASPDTQYYSDAKYELGRAYVDLKQTDKAEACFNSLLQETKDNTFKAKALVELAMIARNRKDNAKALECYKTVVEQLPLTEQAEDALLAIESIYQAQGNPQAYLLYIESIGKGATKTSDDRELMIFNAAEQIFLAGNYEKALVSLNQYKEQYPQGAYYLKSDFYTAESYRLLGQKEQSVEYYIKAMNCTDPSFSEMAKLQYAELSYGLQHFEDAYHGYETLGKTAAIEQNKYTALIGMMRSAFRAKLYDEAILNARMIAADARTDEKLKREAEYVQAKSYMATSRRSEAMTIFKTLSGSPKTAEGAEAMYVIIQDSFDRGDFDSVEKLTYNFSDSGSTQMYWMAKSFIVLGDSFAEKGSMAQAKATFESIAQGYTPKAGGDEILDNVKMRLSRIEKMND